MLALPRLYAILDPDVIRDRSSEEALRALLDGGAAMIQLRAKSLSPRDFLELARRVRAETRARGCRLIVNDRADIALACDADGVHLGQDDLPLGAGRKIMGSRIIGVSTHDIAQAREAERGGADYIGFGPMFGTTTKDTGYSARGIELLGEIRAAVRLPIVAIGGITEEKACLVWRAGADSVAIISDILQSADIATKTRRILANS
jgi:thiamine-phosphate pyrophosphorylase